VKFGFSHSKPGKQPIFAKIFKIQGTKSFPVFTSDAHGLGVTYSLVRKDYDIIRTLECVKKQNFMNTMCIRFSNCYDVYK